MRTQIYILALCLIHVPISSTAAYSGHPPMLAIKTVRDIDQFAPSIIAYQSSTPEWQSLGNTYHLPHDTTISFAYIPRYTKKWGPKRESGYPMDPLLKEGTLRLICGLTTTNITRTPIVMRKITEHERALIQEAVLTGKAEFKKLSHSITRELRLHSERKP